MKSSETAKCIWNFLKNNVKYDIEPDTRQSVKSPSAILSTGYYANGKNDCKHYSQWTAGILSALERKGKKINWCYRFANYRMFTRQPQHVFCVINPNTKNEIWIDAVLNNFNEKKQYVNKIDKKINMPLYKISGFENTSFDVPDAFGQIDIGRTRKRTTTKAQRKATRKAKGGSFLKRGLKKVARGVKKVSFTVPRHAFLGLVKINALNMAYYLNESLKNPAKRQKLLSKWYKLGGSEKTLLLNVQIGVKKYKKKHPQYIGFALEATLASASAIIVALFEFLGKNAKQKTEEVVSQQPAEKQAEIKESIEASKQISTSSAPVPTFSAPTSTARGGDGSTGTGTGTSAKTESEESETEPTESEAGTGMNKNILLYAGIGLGALLLLKKK
jgi:hypothetical protein